jgi:transcriptional regulator with XRE-family HTH domain
MDGIADTFRTRRIAHGLSQAQAAEAAGLSLRTLRSFESGGLGISLGNLRRLLAIVGLDLATREAAARPTLDELEARYAGDENAPAPKPKRIARKRKP